MIVGDVVPQSVIRVDRPNVKATFKPNAGKVAMLLLLGEADKKSPDSFSGVQALKDLGWVREKELADAKQLLKDIQEEMKSEDPNLSLLQWSERINQILSAV